MSSGFVQWVRHFLEVPDETYPNDLDRPLIYMAAVDLIGHGVKTKTDVLVVHRFFTYLLRGWNPITARIKRSMFAKPTDYTGKELFDEDIIPVIKGLMDFDDPVPTRLVYAWVLRFTRDVAKHGDNGENWYIEQRAVEILGMWMLTRTPSISIPKDAQSIRSCLDLYYKNVVADTSSDLIGEYLNRKNVPYSKWLNNNLNRLMISRMSQKEWVSTFVFLSYFVSLIRANRMLQASGTLKKVIVDNDITTKLNTLVAQMHERLNNLPITGETESRPFNRLISVLGIKPRKTK